jgi:hypothetical protein
VRLWAALRAECPLPSVVAPPTPRPESYTLHADGDTAVGVGGGGTGGGGKGGEGGGGGGGNEALTDPPDDDDNFVPDLDPCRLAVEVLDSAQVAVAQAAAAAAAEPAATAGLAASKMAGESAAAGAGAATTSELCAAAAELDRAVRAAAAVDPRILRDGGDDNGGGGGGGGGGGVDTGCGGGGSGVEAGVGAQYGPGHPLVTCVLSNTRLTAEGASNEVRHVVIDATAFAGCPLPGSEHGHRGGGGGDGGGHGAIEGYSPGDCLAVMPLGAAGGQDPAGEDVAEVMHPKPQTLDLESWILNPSLSTLDHRPYILSPKALALSPETGSLDSRLDPESYILYPKP